MGISGLGEFLKSRNVPCFFTVPLSTFHERRIAIDGQNWLYTYLYPSLKTIVLKMDDPLEPVDIEEVFSCLIRQIINFNLKFLRCEITPVWVWDGKSKKNKKQTQDERRERKRKEIEIRDNLRDSLLEMSILERPLDVIEKYRNYLIKTTFLPKEKIDELKEFLKKMGIPTLTARDEGENLCSFLAVERIVGAIWTADTDSYAIGAPVVVKGFVKSNKFTQIEGVFTLNILRHFNLTHKEFRDFCIMCGTDFNQRIRGNGAKRSMDLIQKYRDIETIQKETKMDMQSLRHEEVRELLNAEPSGYLDREEELNVDLKTCEKNLNEYKKYEDAILELRRCIKNLPPPVKVPKNVEIEDSKKSEEFKLINS